MEDENNKKNIHGANGITSLEHMIDSLIGHDYIVSAKKKYRLGDPEYEEDQFYFQFLIEFQDHEQWILHHTTSIRDRINEQQWNGEHIKRLNSYVKKAYVIVPDALSTKEKAVAQSYNNKIINRKIYSAIDGVVPFETMYRMIEQKGASLMGAGQAKAKLGIHFETKLVESLKNQENLDKWKNDTTTSVGYLYSLFVDVMKSLHIDSSRVSYIEATSDIPKLPSGGMPKTDVIATIKMVDGTIKTYTFSCKRSSSDRVSVHEYSADSFSKVLNPNDDELNKLLVEFQTKGGIRSMDSIHVDELTKRLSLYKQELYRWALAGVGGEGDPETQWASYIIIYNEKSNLYSIKSIEEYISTQEKNGVKGQLGTIFQWTYPSGGLGKRIQLKLQLD